MLTTEILHKDWTRALDQFSLVHEGWLVSLDVLSPQLGVQTQLHEVPLLSVTAESGHDGPDVVVAAARSDGEHFWHVSPGAARIRLEQTEEHADVALEVESADGTISILRFRTPALPETVDGVAHTGEHPGIAPGNEESRHEGERRDDY